jgi:hypothetical protein
VPDEAIDAVWHAHILDTQAYIRDCERLFGRYLHHVPAYDPTPAEQAESIEAFLATNRMFELHFGAPLEAETARCQGKPCHAPTPCRCR